MNKKLYYIFCLVCITQISYSFPETQDSLVVSIDTSSLTIDDFSDHLNEKYNGDEFNYDTVEGEAQNFLARAIDWLFNGIRDIFGINVNPEVAKLIENIIYFLLIGAAIYFVIRVLTGKDAVSFFRNKDNMVAPINISEEHIENIDLNDLIANAISEKDYRLAIRYMYLKALQDLSINKIIDYHFEKTNTDYSREISDTTLKKNFNRVSYLYDYIWYGEFELDEERYYSAKKSFDQLQTKMNNLG